MGCVNSRTDINDLHPNIFQVMNVDDLGNLVTPGRLEITESDIVLYQRGKPPVKWPLRCLRRYGYDSEIFSFESGRRCSTGPGIYAFKCRRADQLFNLVQSNIQVCNSSGDDTVSRDLSIATHSVPTITRMTMPPAETNYLDPMPPRCNTRITSRFSHSQQNGIARLSSIGSSSGPMSPQGTISSPSPPPTMPSVVPISHHHPSAVYVNDQVISAIAMDIELDNNNKSLRRTMQRSYTLSSTSSAGMMPDSACLETKSLNRPPPLPSASATYMNIDLNNEQNPLSPTYSTTTTSTSQISRDDSSREIDRNRHAYMNISPAEVGLENSHRIRQGAAGGENLSQQLPQHSAGGEWEDSAAKHCYANLERAEIEELRLRYNGGDSTARTDKSNPLTAPQPPPLPPPLPASLPSSLALSTSAQQPSTPPPLGVEPIREVNYAVLDLDKNSVPTASGTTQSEHVANAIPSPPDSPNKPQKGYATIDFNKTAALSHSVNPNVAKNNEGSRKTRHNSTINELAAPSRHSSSISE